MSTAIVQAETFNKPNVPSDTNTTDSVDNTTRREQIMNLLSSSPRIEFRVPEIADAIGASQSQVSGLLSQMRDEAGLSRVGRGVYVFGLEKKVWAGSNAGRPKSGTTKVAKSKNLKSKNSKAAAKPRSADKSKAEVDLGWTEVGTVFRDPQGRLVMVTPLAPEIAAALGS